MLSEIAGGRLFAMGKTVSGARPRPDWLCGTVLLLDETKRRRKKWDHKDSLQLDLLIVRKESRKGAEKTR